MSKLSDFLHNPGLQEAHNRALWQSIHAMPEVFGSHRKTIAPGAYKPLELFRGAQAPANAHRRFLSSGTTQASRSHSYFSHDGLLLYKAAALKTFAAMMNVMMPTEDDSYPPGISLIPTTAEWPDSSLAQMVAWISEFWPVTYTDEAHLPEVLASVGAKPVWLFGTGFHYVHLSEQNAQCPLPAGSIVIETGGTKGKSRSVTRAELHELITHMCAVPAQRIVSEYGMCELACQAYEFSSDANNQKHFVFPAWVKTGAMLGLGYTQASGEGALIIADPLRIDEPLPIRVQDVVRLSEDGGFALLGRSQEAPLKGCSLQVEDVLGPSEEATDEATEPTAESMFAYLKEEFASERCARSALADMQADMPQGEEDWAFAIKQSQARPGERWLILCPNNHSLAAFYPIGVGLAAGLTLFVRLPKNFGMASALGLFLQHNKEIYGDRLHILANSFRIEPTNPPLQVQGILCFGNDETVTSLRSMVTMPVVGFGHRVTVASVDIRDNDSFPALAKDILSLGQRGCLSVQGLFVERGEHATELPEQLAHLRDVCVAFWQEPLSTFARVSLDHAEVALSLQWGEQVRVLPRTTYDQPVFALFNWQPQLDLAAVFGVRQNMVVPVIAYQASERAAVNAHCQRYSWLHIHTQLGTANRRPWDGTHESRPLFQTLN